MCDFTTDENDRGRGGFPVSDQLSRLPVSGFLCPHPLKISGRAIAINTDRLTLSKTEPGVDYYFNIFNL